MSSLSSQDLVYIESLGISKDKIQSQLEYFKKGFPFTKIAKPCLISDGIYVIPENEFENLIIKSDKAANDSRLMKFVPASGAASRMFKTLTFFNNNFENITDTNIKILAENGDKEAQELYRFISKIKEFAFFDDLRVIMAKDGFDIYSLIDGGEYKEVINYLLEEKGLNYSNLPKGLLKFHKYKDAEPRTSFEEHLVEAIVYTKDKNNNVKIHFTVSPEHLEKIQEHFNQIKMQYEKMFNIKFQTDFSVQKKSTDTIAVDLDNNPFYEDDKILFRPGGHGSLIENLDDLKADIVFIKNIDNVVPDRLKSTTYTYKKALAGYLITIQDKCFSYLEKLDNTEPDKNFVQEIFSFLEKDLFIYIPQSIRNNQLKIQKEFAYNKLNRPIRVCGMVKNQGEPGGGPFWTKSAHGDSVQIVESSQINLKSEEQKEIFSRSTHFNPVDLVCAVKDYKGNNFDLEKYIDYETGFISNKSKDGKELKALELPGLWNGAMAYWNTIFIEVPVITFNPVKTINDLLRDKHQNLG